MQEKSAIIGGTCSEARPRLANCEALARTATASARPNIACLIAFSRLICPSTGPLLQSNPMPDRTATPSWHRRWANDLSSDTDDFRARSDQSSRSCGRLWRINEANPSIVSATSRMTASPEHKVARACWSSSSRSVGRRTIVTASCRKDGRAGRSWAGDTGAGAPAGSASAFNRRTRCWTTVLPPWYPVACNSRRICRAFPHPSASRRRM